MFSLALAFLAQVGPFVTGGAQPASPLPPEVIQRQEREKEKRASASQAASLRDLPQARNALDGCLAAVNGNPLQGSEAAQAWLDKAKAAEAPQAGHCLGVALGRLERWDEAEQAFAAARAAAPASNRIERARLGAMAGNAALAAGRPDAALASLDGAHGDALGAGDKPLAGDIAIDRARALVALGRDGEAAMALDEASATIPGNAQAWLLSATLARRMGKLPEAQTRIEKAAELMPVDPDIGLEAGVIAVLSGRDEAARKSWQSVIDAAPGSDAAATARGYIDQLGPVAPPAKDGVTKP